MLLLTFLELDLVDFFAKFDFDPVSLFCFSVIFSLIFIFTGCGSSSTTQTQMHMVAGGGEWETNKDYKEIITTTTTTHFTIDDFD